VKAFVRVDDKKELINPPRIQEKEFKESEKISLRTRGTHGGALIITILEAVVHSHARAYYFRTNICTLTSAFPITVDGRTLQCTRAAADGPTDGLPELGQLQ
jgi:hypothetical protein